MKFKILLVTLFSLLAYMGFAQFETVGIIGSATPNGWDESTPMTQDAEDPNVWTIEIALVDGEAKFRADNDWSVNWGNNTFPAGLGEQDGANIPVRAGEYRITFNASTGEYLFDFDGEIGVIGSATPFGWDRETFMVADVDNPDLFSITLSLNAGEAKFRADGSWDVNWGGEGFPAGEAILNGPNIPINQAGRYNITFDRANLTYSFEEIVSFTSVGVRGSATPGGNDEVTPLNREGGDPNRWSAVIDFTDGGLVFVSDEMNNLVWGGSDFPSGIAEVDGPEVPISEGRYILTFNTSTLEYSFLEIVPFSTVGIIGNATPGGWDSDTPMIRDENNESLWRIRAVLVDGEMKFRADNDWSVNWGAGDFPTGVAIQNGPNIPVPAGEYRITFNSTTGEYNFEEIVEFAAVSLVGASGPFLAWPGDDDSRDTYMTKDPNDGNVWTLASVELIDYDAAADGGLKFRANASWTVNWGAEEFPSGTGLQNGPNIQPVAGTYSVVFNSASGEYAFSEVSTSNRENWINPASITLFPNPAQDRVTINTNGHSLEGEITISIFAIGGTQISTQKLQAQDQLQLNVAHLNNGNYLLQISNGKSIVGKKLTVLK